MPSSFSTPVAEREVKVWTFSTATSAEISAKYLEVLDGDECNRAAQFSSGRDRDAFVVTRGVLRHLLGSCLGLHPASIRFTNGAKGKPQLTPATTLRFNVSHSGELAAIAITASCEIGIDLEQIRPIPEMEEIVERYFHVRENAQILSRPREARDRTFFRFWTRKEAYLKAIGEGLSQKLLTAPVLSHPDLQAETVDQAADGTRSVWTFQDLDFGDRFSAAVAYGDSRRPLSVFPTIDHAMFLGLPQDAAAG
jgi:4'-phosphopantetheinyl transferase